MKPQHEFEQLSNRRCQSDTGHRLFEVCEIKSPLCRAMKRPMTSCSGLWALLLALNLWDPVRAAPGARAAPHQWQAADTLEPAGKLGVWPLAAIKISNSAEFNLDAADSL